MRHALGFVLFGGWLICIGGCRTAPQPDRPPLGIAVPERYAAPSPDSDAGLPVAVAWTAQWPDYAATSYVTAVLSGNPDLHLAAQRLAVAAWDVRIAGADRWPTVGTELGARRGRSVLETAAGPVSSTDTRFSLGLAVAWEADVWGKLSDTRRAVLADYGQAAAAYAGARLSLSVQAARAWYAAVAAQLQWQLARDNLASQDETADWVRRRYEAGLAGALDLQLALATAAEARATRDLRAQRLSESVRDLELLLGVYPSGSLAVDGAFPATWPAIPAGVPATLLARRWDLQEREAAWRAAHARADRARKELLPGIRLTGSLGTTSSELRHLLDTPYLVWQLAAGLTQPLFRGGELRGRSARAATAAEAAALDYAAVALRALGEVEQALSDEAMLQARVTSTERAVAEAAAAEALAWDEYSAGLREFTVWLDARRRHLALQAQLIDVTQGRIANRLQLLLALGGDVHGTIE
jgi:outer membrane protein, multidrug efflux system